MTSPARSALVLLAAQLVLGGCTTPASAPGPSALGKVDVAMSEPANHQSFEPLLQVAIRDLAERLRIPPEDIGVIEARAVVWPDRSLGCPRPGLAYLQVPQDGAVIRLQAHGREFSYHSGGGRRPFLCEKTR